MDFGEEERKREMERVFLRAVNQALDAVSLKAFCERAGATESDVSRARNGKRLWQQRWTDELLSMPDVPDQHKAAILSVICARAGMAPIARQPETTRDVAEAAIATIRKFGELGSPLADELEMRLAAALAAEGRR